jgi:SAM-dependent methyltransferase
MTKTLDLGCGTSPKNPFNANEVFGIDIRKGLAKNILTADLTIENIPFEDDSFEYVTAFDFIEHIPRVIYHPNRRNPFIELMNEVYRVLKPEGLFLSFTPAFPHAAAFQDPTHVNIITEETFPCYFDNTNRWASAYGFKGSFRIVQQEWRGVYLFSQMQKVHVAIEPSEET